MSGGLDSDVLLAEMAVRYRRVYPIYIRQGLAWEEAELFWLRKFIQNLHMRSLKPLQVFSLPMADLYGAHWSTGRKSVPGPRTRDEAVYLPGRNMVLSVKAAVFAAMNKIPALALGSLDHNPFPDASPRFFKQWSAALRRGLASPLKVLAPYRHLSKVQVIRRGEHLPLHLSFSCIAPNGKSHCGRCNKCAERRRAFKVAGVEDKTVYVKN
jgi:7-cyano-7-deazaguanine synthase